MKRHCDLCDHQKLSLKEGSLCGLTNKKPSFNRTCTKIDFDNNLFDHLEAILFNIEDLKLTKTKVYKNFIYGSIIGILLIVSSYFVFTYFLNNGFRVSIIKFDRSSINKIGFLILIPSLILIPGYYFITKSFNKYINHKKDLAATEKNKLEIDEVLNLYNQKYKYKVKFDKEIHGIQEVEIDVKLI
jgi:hypothetical protein